MTSPKPQPKSEPAAGPLGATAQFFGQFLNQLFDKLTSLPRGPRSVAYFVLLAFFCATVWRVVAGEYVVHGVLWQGAKAATDCEVRVGTDYYSTNSKGMYYLMLNSSQYYRLVAKSAASLKITCRERIKMKVGEKEIETLGEMVPMKGSYRVPLSWWDDELDELDLNAPAKQESAQFDWSLGGVAHAQEPKVVTKSQQLQAPVPPQKADAGPPVSPAIVLPSKGDRLVVERIQLGAAARSMRKVEFEIDLGDDDEQPLLLRGDEVGKLPMKSTVAFGDSYYFDVPRSGQGSKVHIEMEATGLFGPKEKFKFKLPTQYDLPVSVPGTLGSTLVLRLVPHAPPVP